MNVERVTGSDSLIIAIRGRLDAANADHLAAEIDEAVREGNHTLTLRLAQVDYISSAGVRVLIKYYQSLKKLGGALAVSEPSEAVLSMLELSGLTALLSASKSPASSVSDDAPEERRAHGLHLSCYSGQADGVECRVIGNAECLVSSAAAKSTALALPRDVAAIGLGALGSGFDDCRNRFGEFIAVAGGAAYLPSDGSKTPDYVLAAQSMTPEMQVLYALSVRGALDHCIRFESIEEGASLTSLARVAHKVVDADAVAMVIVAETAGLIGAALRRSPGTANDRSELFEHPNIRDWLSFTPERVHGRSLALVAGVSTTGKNPLLAPMIRPLDPSGELAGHFHAAAFTYTALAKGRLQLEPTVASLFEDQKLLGILHLMNDARAIAGAGESLFLRGVAWAGPVTRIVGEEEP